MGNNNGQTGSSNPWLLPLGIGLAVGGLIFLAR
jgi:LPXTG-motif cell wall-anchored protein